LTALELIEVVTGGVWSRLMPGMGLTDRISDIERILDLAPRSDREALARTIRNDEFTVDCTMQLSSEASISVLLIPSRTGLDLDLANGFMQARRRMVFTAAGTAPGRGVLPRHSIPGWSWMIVTAPTASRASAGTASRHQDIAPDRVDRGRLAVFELCDVAAYPAIHGSLPPVRA